MGRVFLVLCALVVLSEVIACYWLIEQQRIEDTIGVIVMSMLTLWFYAVDAHVDEMFQRDEEKAKYENQLWKKDMY